MAEVNRTCKTCGKEYFYCSHCNKSLNSPQWMLMWHEQNCKNVFEIVSDYAQGRIQKNEAKKQLEYCNLKNFYTYNEKIRNLIEEIQAEEVVETTQTQRSTSKSQKRNRKKI